MLSSRAVGAGALLVTALGWGFGWVALKVVLQTWPPLFARGIAGLIAAVLLTAAAHYRGESLRVPADVAPRLALAAFTNVFAWMGFSAVCLKWLSVGEGALLVFTMPIWATLFAWFFLGNQPGWRGLASLVLGFAGVSILLGGSGLAFGTDKVIGVVVALSAAILFALGAVLNRGALRIAPVASTAWQVGLGCLPMVLIGLAVEQTNVSALDGPGLVALAYMALLPMGICYVTWFEALRRLPPAVASTSTLLVPLTGILSASLILGEPLGMREALAMALTLGGVVLALRNS
jgi:drug/metabolite transporter (DMT)-like permease